jgi:hypothetical protein
MRANGLASTPARDASKQKRANLTLICPHTKVEQRPRAKLMHEDDFTTKNHRALRIQNPCAKSQLSPEILKPSWIYIFHLPGR